MKNYNHLIKEFKSLGGKSVGEIGIKKEKYPIYMLKRGKGKKILLFGCVHGNEQSGLDIIVNFFKKHIHKYESQFEITAFPCINPWGFQYYDRENRQDQDLNRVCRKETLTEDLKLIFPHLEQYLFAMDFHETDFDPEDPTSTDKFFLWETQANRSKRIGQNIVRNIVANKLEVCTQPLIYGDINNRGVIWYPENCRNPEYKIGPFDSYLINNNHTRHSFVIEIPQWSKQKQILAGTISLETALEEIK